jgi:hypothetical protein
MVHPNVEALTAEFLRYRRLLELAAEQVSEADFFHSSEPEGNSMAVIVQHLAGNLRSRFTDFLTSDGEKPWRERDSEFESPDLDRSQLLAHLAGSWSVLESALQEVAREDAFHATVTIRDQPLTVMAALYRSLAHVSYHVGQVVLLGRQAKGADWVSLSVPKGMSAAYAKNPTREKNPDGAL